MSGLFLFGGLMRFLEKVEEIRKKYRVDESGSLALRLPYKLCEDVGIDTEGMSPREAWEAYLDKTGGTVTGEIKKSTAAKKEKKKDKPEPKEKKPEPKQEEPKKSVSKVMLGGVECSIDTDNETLKSYEKTMKAWEKEHFNDVFDLTESEKKEVSKKLTKMFDDSYICSNANDAYLEDILLDHFKNLMETKHGDGLIDEDYRKSVSERLFGTDWGAEDSGYEKYGFIIDKSDDFYDLFGGYGTSGGGSQICFRFKDSIKDRTTYTVDDSLDDYEERVAGVVDTNASIHGISYAQNYYSDNATDICKGILTGKISNLKKLAYEADGAYIEAQLHGIVGAADIEDVVWRNVFSMQGCVDGMSDKAKKVMIDNGINICYYDGGNFVKKSAKEVFKGL